MYVQSSHNVFQGFVFLVSLVYYSNGQQLFQGRIFSLFGWPLPVMLMESLLGSHSFYFQ